MTDPHTPFPNRTTDVVVFTKSSDRHAQSVAHRVPAERVPHVLSMACGAARRWRPADGVAVVVRVLHGCGPSGVRP